MDAFLPRAKEPTMNTDRRHIVVGVVAGQPPAVLEQAAYFARQFDADLVCGSVDANRYVVEEKEDGTVVSLSINPDLVDLREETLDPRVEEEITRALAGSKVEWSAWALAGDPAEALAHLADRYDAILILVGTRKSGVRRSVYEFFNGSVGARLAHRQHRPVVIIPLSPVSLNSELPWASDS
jgi:nucleotide-binding universal stress UspA family protein